MKLVNRHSKALDRFELRYNQLSRVRCLFLELVEIRSGGKVRGTYAARIDSVRPVPRIMALK